ncbi:TetR family transcriptional regulator [Nocardia neocaledoniensis NBRC 108232]|uniref:TetR family transcriptional regulator n=1 Tax=Nocardia neocaledoniensis TaxID=236511 RepID=A0A317NL45_9NOCA|nr:TetR/AcrR family transcriptional regulator [Nocardia neocaledoniensis]PWV74338.1 TetR family transcriptional regulator [Nocardia neocaledoniensis]GEM29167.1 TetR family transcriptional regulator [Nocardia neocaledoniensis NBRC 108232]
MIVSTPRSQRRLTRRNQFLDIAHHAFATRGYHGVTMQRVSACAGVTKPVLYRHFSGKLELYLAVVQRYLDQLTDAVRAASRSTSSRHHTVERTVEAFFDLVEHDESGLHVLIFDSSLPSEPAVRLRVQQAVADFTVTVARMLHPHSEIPLRANLLASWLTGVAIAAAGQWHREGRTVPKRHAVATATHLCCAGLSGSTLRGPRIAALTTAVA